MDYKVRLKIGLLLTAMITPLLLSNIMPPLLGALIFLLAGISLSYFVAADYVKERKIRDMAVMIKAMESFDQKMKKNEILSLLEIWIPRLISCDEYYLWVKDQEPADKWQNLIAMYREEPEPQLLKTDLPEGLAVGLFIPVVVKADTIAVLLAADREAEKLRPVHIKLIQPLLNTAKSILENIAEQEAEQAFTRELFLAVLRAGEGFNPAMVGHSARVAKIALLIGSRLGLNEIELSKLEYGAFLHDIGQSAVLYHGLNPGYEGEKIDHTTHPILGASLIPAGEQYLEIKQAVLYHHEHYDGSGYPEKLAYTDIPLVARIIAVADTYDALTYLASDEEQVSHEEALAFIKKALGTWFDPLVVVALEEVEREVATFLKEDKENADK